MMKILILLFLIFTLFLTGCFSHSSDILVDADKSSFYYYNKSKQKVVYKYTESLTGIKLWERRKNLDVDVKSFIVLSSYYAKDKNGGYFEEKKLDADAKSFIVLSSYYAKDKNGGYFKEKKFDADGQTLEYLQQNYCKDKNNLFYQGNIVENVDVSSFVVDKDFFKDKYHVFIGEPEYKDSKYYLPIVDGAIPDEYDHIRGAWSKDSFSYFCFGKKIDVYKATFEIINDHVAVDKKYLYHTLAGELNKYKLEGELHSLIKNMYYDDKTIYNFREYPISTIKIKNPETIKLIDTTSSRIVFFVDNILYWNLSYRNSDNIDIASFQINQNNRDYATDKTRIYFRGNEIKGADLSSFKLLEHQFSKDKNYVYFRDHLLDGADPESFEYISTKKNTAKDFDFCRDVTHRWKYQNGNWIIF